MPGGRSTPWPIGPTGSTLYVGSPGQRYMAVMANAQSGSVQAVGFASAANVGGTDPVQNADDSDGPWVRIPTSGLAGAAVNTGFTFNGVRRDWDPEFYGRIKTGTPVNDVRYWVGLFSGTPVLSPTPAVSLAAFRFDTSAGDQRWKFCAGAGGALTCTDTGIGIAESLAYTFAITCGAGDCVGSINGNVVARHAPSDNLPSADTNLFYHTGIRPLANGNYTFLFGRVTILHR